MQLQILIRLVFVCASDLLYWDLKALQLSALPFTGHLGVFLFFFFYSGLNFDFYYYLIYIWGQIHVGWAMGALSNSFQQDPVKLQQPTTGLL